MLKCLIFVVALLALAATGAPAWAAWGCAARGDNGSWGNSFGQPDRETAEREAMDVCGGNSCRIIGCDSHIDTRAQERVMWPPPNAPTICRGAAC